MATPFPSDARALQRMDFCPSSEDAERCSSSQECSAAARQCFRHRVDLLDAGRGDEASVRRLAPLLEPAEIVSWRSLGVGRKAEAVARGGCELLSADRRREELWSRLGARRASFGYGSGAAPSGSVVLPGDDGPEAWLDKEYLPSLGSLAVRELRTRSGFHASRFAGIGAMLAYRDRDGE